MKSALFKLLIVTSLVAACSESNFSTQGEKPQTKMSDSSNAADGVSVLPSGSSAKSTQILVKSDATPDVDQIKIPVSTSTDSSLSSVVTAIPSGGGSSSDPSSKDAKAIATPDPKGSDSLVANPLPGATATPTPQAADVSTATTSSCDGNPEGAILVDPTKFAIAKAPRGDVCTNHYAQKKCVSGSWQQLGSVFDSCKNAEVMTPRSLAISNTGVNNGTCSTSEFNDIDGFSGSYRLYCTTGQTNGVLNNAVSYVTFGWDQTLLPNYDRLVDWRIESMDSTGNFIFKINNIDNRVCPSGSCGGSSIKDFVNSVGPTLYFNVQNPCHTYGVCNAFANMYMRVTYRYH